MHQAGRHVKYCEEEEFCKTQIISNLIYWPHNQICIIMILSSLKVAFVLCRISMSSNSNLWRKENSKLTQRLNI